jgi:hypothetical protein
MTNKDVIEALAIIKGAKVYHVDFQNATFECGESVFSFQLTKYGLIKSNSVKFLYAIDGFKKAIKSDKFTDIAVCPATTG